MNLAVFLPNWIGDVVMATPALRALRSRFAGGHFVGVLRPYVAGVLEGSPWFDEVLLTGDGTWGHSVPALAWQLRRRRIDVAVLLPNSFRPALAAWLGGCRRRVGYARYARGLLLTDPLQPLRDERGRIAVAPVVDAYNALAERVGCPAPGYGLELFTTPADEAAADEGWRQAGLYEYPEVVCLNSGAAFGAAKHWPVEYFATLARDLAEARGCGVMVLCGPGERGQAREIAARAAHPAVRSLGDLADGALRLSIGLTKACIRRCDLLVTTDSGPRHFAHAFGRPVVSLFGPTHIGWTETYHPKAIHLQKSVPCGPCQKRVCPLDHRCMRELTPAEVRRAAESLLAAGRRADY